MSDSKELLIVELDERYEFAAAEISSANDGCTNGDCVGSTNTGSCHNTRCFV